MDIVNFFEKVEGSWFSQRTTHFAPGHPSQTGQATLHIHRTPLDDPKLEALCQQFSTQVEDVLFGLNIQREEQAGLYGSGKATPPQMTLLIVLKTTGDTSGQFFSQTDTQSAVAGLYSLEDEVLTLTIQTEEMQSKERMWFMNPNLRMRTNLLKRTDGLQMASFCSEIRRLSK